MCALLYLPSRRVSAQPTQLLFISAQMSWTMLDRSGSFFWRMCQVERSYKHQEGAFAAQIMWLAACSGNLSGNDPFRSLMCAVRQPERLLLCIHTSTVDVWKKRSILVVISQLFPHGERDDASRVRFKRGCLRRDFPRSRAGFRRAGAALTMCPHRDLSLHHHLHSVIRK